MSNKMNRRDILAKLGLLGLTPQMVLSSCTKKESLNQRGEAPKSLGLSNKSDRKFLFVFGAMGGASINDSFLAVKNSECDYSETHNTFPDEWVKTVEGTQLRAVDLTTEDIGPLPFPVKSKQSAFLEKHAKEIMVTTMEHSTVSHPLGQKRFLTGNGAWNGRTMQEIIADTYGKGLILPNVNMSSLGFAEAGTDRTLPPEAVAEIISNPTFFTLGLHGYKGISGAPEDDLMNLARSYRGELEKNSKFYQTHASNTRLRRWLDLRSNKQKKIENANLIEKLLFFEESTDLPFSDFGINPTANGSTVRELFPDIGADPLHTQAALAYMLVTQGVSKAVAMGMGMNVTINGNDPSNPLLTNTPTGFDYSHNAHRATQALLWNRTFDIIDRLITLLKKTEYGDGGTIWDNSMILIATEFGRDKTRPKDAEEFPSGHHQNNGVAVISPLVNGGKILGGVDPNTLLTYGYDPKTGASDKNRQMTEKEVFSGLLQALDVDTSPAKLPDMPIMKKG